MSKDIKIGQKVFVVDYWGPTSGTIRETTCTGQRLVDGCAIEWYVECKWDDYDNSRWLDDCEVFITKEEARKDYLKWKVHAAEEGLRELQQELKKIEKRIKEQEDDLAQAKEELSTFNS